MTGAQGGMRAPLVQFHLLVVIWSFTGILGEVISLSSPALVMWRTFLASIAYYLWVRWRRPERMRVTRPVFWVLVRNGMILGAHWLCFFGAIALSNVSVGLAGFAATSLFTAVVEPVLEKRRVRMRELGLGGLVLMGLLLIAGGAESVYRWGLLVALFGALLAAVYTVLNRRMVMSGVPATTILLYGMPGSFLTAVLAILLVPSWEFERPMGSDWWPLLVLALGCTCLAYIWYANLMRYLTAYASNLVMNFEPVYGILLAALFFREHENLPLTFYLGTAAIVAANVLHGWMGRRKFEG